MVDVSEAVNMMLTVGLGAVGAVGIAWLAAEMLVAFYDWLRLALGPQHIRDYEASRDWDDPEYDRTKVSANEKW